MKLKKYILSSLFILIQNNKMMQSFDKDQQNNTNNAQVLFKKLIEKEISSNNTKIIQNILKQIQKNINSDKISLTNLNNIWKNLITQLQSFSINNNKIKICEKTLNEIQKIPANRFSNNYSSLSTEIQADIVQEISNMKLNITLDTLYNSNQLSMQLQKNNIKKRIDDDDAILNNINTWISNIINQQEAINNINTKLETEYDQYQSRNKFPVKFFIILCLVPIVVFLIELFMQNSREESCDIFYTKITIIATALSAITKYLHYHHMKYTEEEYNENRTNIFFNNEEM